MARRAAGMLKRVSKETPIIFTGGVANNACMVRQVTAELGSEVIVPPQPHLVGAYGAALLLLRNKG